MNLYMQQKLFSERLSTPKTINHKKSQKDISFNQDEQQKNNGNKPPVKSILKNGNRKGPKHIKIDGLDKLENEFINIKDIFQKMKTVISCKQVNIQEDNKKTSNNSRNQSANKQSMMATIKKYRTDHCVSKQNRGKQPDSKQSGNQSPMTWHRNQQNSKQSMFQSYQQNLQKQKTIQYDLKSIKCFRDLKPDDQVRKCVSTRFDDLISRSQQVSLMFQSKCNNK